MDYKKSLDLIEKTLIELQEENRINPIIVEGDKDVIALRKLDINGIIVSANAGLTLTDFCDRIAKNYKKIIILTDWDSRGGRICRTIINHLKGRVFCDIRFRKILAQNISVKTIEGLPSWLENIRSKLGLFAH